MAQQDKTTFEGTFNNSSTGLFKTNTTKDIGSDDLRTLVDNLTDSVPFNQDDKYTWSFPQVSTTGTNTYAATPSPAIAAYSTGQAFKVKFTEASTGASTLNLNGLGAKKLYVNPTTQATTGDIVDEQVYLLIYDAALDAAAGGFLMIGGSGGGGGTWGSITGTLSDQTDLNTALGLKAPLASPTFTGTPAAPTAAAGTSTTQVATTAFVQQELATVSINTRTTDYTLALTDAGNVVSMNLTGTANSLTVPPNASVAFPIGTQITVKQNGTGVTTVVEGSGVTVTPPAGGNLIAPGQGQPMVLLKTGTDTWDLYNGNAPSALTKTDNANVGITLGGAPATSLLNPVSITVNWLAPTGTAALNFGSIAAGGNEVLTITVTGAADGDTVILGVPNGSMTAGLVFTAWVSAADTVSVQCYNSTGGALDPASGTFRATIIKH